MKQSRHLVSRTIAVIIANIMMGVTLTFVLRARLGSDPCSSMNVGISSHLPISFGTWCLLLNIVLCIFVLIFNRKLLGVGSVANMVLIGYTVDFCNWVLDRTVPAAFFEPLLNRVLICIPALALFIFSAALYMSVDMGVSPYDAMPYIIAERQSKYSFRAVRTAWDMVVLLIGVVTGATFGPVTIIMAFTLGTVISFVTKKIQPLWTSPEQAAA